MIRRCQYIVIMVLLLSGIGIAMAQNRNTLSINRNSLTLQIDLQSPKKSIDSILNIAGESTAISERIMVGDFDELYQNGWHSESRSEDLIRFVRSLNTLNDNPPDNPYVASLRIPQLDGKPGYPAEVRYGINKFAKITVYELSSGLTRFILPGFTHVKRVFLSGNFNQWSTLKGIMKKTDGGWIIDLKLQPGVYQYKYIIGGRWSTDPNNLQEAEDGSGNTNSVYFKYNYTFKLKGYAAAHRVMIAGEFNKWNANELVMERKDNSWEKELYLGDGDHEYRFLVDGNWINDPANPDKEKSRENYVNSVLKLGETVHFKLHGYPDAKRVFIAGDFNKWKPNELSLKKNGDGWVLPMVLHAGNYGYKFIVDGTWITDPQNGNYVEKGGETNSFVAAKPDYTFKLKGYDDAKSIKLSGTFNNWDHNGYTLSHIGKEWTISLYLKPGKYLYKFIVDGRWIIDPGNKYWEQDEHDNGNSVLWIE